MKNTNEKMYMIVLAFFTYTVFARATTSGVVADPAPPTLDQSNVTTSIPGVGRNFTIGANLKL
ncbi:MAG: hypothetical protein AAF600_12340 [Bacteroidota bacterium]